VDPSTGVPQNKESVPPDPRKGSIISNNMTITSISYTCTCRKCNSVANLECNDFPDQEGLGVEVDLHLHLESQGWINELCPDCVIKEYEND